MEYIQMIFTTSFYDTIIRVATPLLLATMGAVITSNAGITNIGLEGVMLTSALVAVLSSAFGFGPWFGLLIAVITGILASLFIGYVSLKLKTDSALTFITFNAMASGGTIFFMYSITGDKGTTSSLNSGVLPNITIPIIKDIPILNTIFSGHNVVAYIAVIAIIAVWILLYKTPMGLRIRAAGEAPQSLESVGQSVFKTKMIALAISGILGGIAGAYMSMGYVSWFSKDMLAGRGFIAMAADAMGKSTPLGASLAAILFAFAEAWSYALQLTSIPTELVQMIPYVVSVVGLVVFSIRVKRENEKKKMRLALEGSIKHETKNNY
ncbi:ABC transporter permease [Erysipelothrix rhusiopathiae]|uniref:ABC transporter permease n=1 Tax=Erysipelothrix rhusiopathiae TaxID=1648 RepID=UPI0024814D15|nr:ABC transporter permease [Erysipelothrix rhusiopathiae]